MYPSSNWSGIGTNLIRRSLGDTITAIDTIVTSTAPLILRCRLTGSSQPWTLKEWLASIVKSRGRHGWLHCRSDGVTGSEAYVVRKTSDRPGLDSAHRTETSAADRKVTQA